MDIQSNSASIITMTEFSSPLGPMLAGATDQGVCLLEFNRIAIVVPCHRVIGSNGSLTGYAGGIDKKKWLLQFERAHSEVPDGCLF